MKRGARFVIDKITNSIEKRTNGQSFETSIVLVTADEIKRVHKKDGWYFNWKTEYKEEGRHIYKLTLADDNEIQGLLSLQPAPHYIEMHLIESAPHNFGAHKEFLGVAGNLVAFACKMSYEMGFDGNVGFTAKTRLKQHYIDTLGAEILFGDRMGLMGNSAKNLVNSYFKNVFDGR